MGGRKLQEAIRKLREEWKTADQGGLPNHALWKRFDRACNAAHKFVDAWLDQVRAESAQHKAQRQALIDEVKAWGAAQQAGASADWKAMGRQIHQFSERWRNAGHLAEGLHRAAGAVEGRHPPGRRAAGGRAEGQHRAPPGTDCRGRAAGRRAAAAHRRRARCSSAGRPRRRPCRWSAATSRSCGTPSASPSTRPSTARAPSASSSRPP
jgi:hypothetical protein